MKIDLSKEDLKVLQKIEDDINKINLFFEKHPNFCNYKIVLKKIEENENKPD
jgi:hypothetical protein